jgi:IS30 family transposase
MSARGHSRRLKHLAATSAIALRLNQRPRKTLGFQTPADRLQTVSH